MIGKSTTGSSFRGLANYLEDKEKIEFKEAHNLAGDHKDHYVRMMEDTASMSKAEKPVYHVSLSYSPEDNPSREMMVEDANQVLEKLGLGDHQAVFVAHKDTDHRHLHMMINRVHPEKGRAWNTFGDRYKIRSIAKEIEIQRGYEETRLKDPNRHYELTNGEYRQFQEHGFGKKMPLKAKVEFYDLDKMFDQAQGWEQLRMQLSEIGCQIKRKGRGGVLQDRETGQTIKLSRIDSDLGRNQSLGRLERRFGKRIEFERVLQAHKELGKHIPDKEVCTDFANFARAQFGSPAMKKSARKTLAKSLSESWKIGKVVKGFTRLAASSNPMSSVAKMGLKIATNLDKEVERSQELGRGR